MLYLGIVLLGATVAWLLASTSSWQQGEENSAIGPHRQGFLAGLDDSWGLGGEASQFSVFFF